MWVRLTVAATSDMPTKLSSPTSAVELVRVLSQQVDTALESGYTRGDEVILVLKFDGLVPALWLLEAISVITGTFAARDVFLSFFFKSGSGVRKLTIRFVVP